MLNGLLRIIFLLLFLGFGLRAYQQQNLSALANTGVDGWGVPFTAEATTDGYLRAILRGDDLEAIKAYPLPTKILSDALSNTSTQPGVLFISPRQDPTSQLTFLLTRYAAWPNRVYEADCDGQGGWDELTPTSFSLVLYFKTEPPTEFKPGSRLLLPQMWLVTAKPDIQWKSYCLQ